MDSALDNREPLISRSHTEEMQEFFQEQIVYSNKIYCLLAIQFLFSFYICGIINSIPLAVEFIQGSYFTVIVAGVQNLIVLMFALCSTHYARIVPTNYILYIVFLFNHAFLVAVASTYERALVYNALLILFGMALCLMVYTRFNDFSPEYMSTGFKVVMFWGLVMLSVSVIVRGLGKYYESLFLPVVGILYGIWLLIDTHVVQPAGTTYIAHDETIIGFLRTNIDVLLVILRTICYRNSKSEEAYEEVEENTKEV
jgi:FtsH-binding integral membrane protein